MFISLLEQLWSHIYILHPSPVNYYILTFPPKPTPVPTCTSVPVYIVKFKQLSNLSLPVKRCYTTSPSSSSYTFTMIGTVVILSNSSLNQHSYSYIYMSIECHFLNKSLVCNVPIVVLKPALTVVLPSLP